MPRPRQTAFGIQIEFDPPSLVRIWKLSQFPAILAANFEVAMQETVDLLAASAAGLFVPQPGHDMSGGRSTGALQTSIGGEVITPFRGEVSTGDLPYAQRVEYGFSGRKDSLGRYYFYWPDQHYFRESIDFSLEEVAIFFDIAVDDTNMEIAL